MTDPLALHVRTFGSGPARALMLHCGLASGRIWQPVLAPLSETVTAFAPDLPGHGRSPAFRPDRDVHDEATDAVRSLFEPGQHLVGHSFGGTVALRLALAAPEAVASLTLIEPVLFAAARDCADFADHARAEAEALDLFRAGDAEGAARLFNRRWGDGIRWQVFPAPLRAAMAQHMAFVSGSEQSLWHDTAQLLDPARLETLSCPVHLMRGAKTVPVIRDIHAGLCQRVPHATETVVDGAGHMLVTTHPQAITDALLSCFS